MAFKLRYVHNFVFTCHFIIYIYIYYFVIFQNVYVNINRILNVASRLIESNHYAAQHIRAVAGRLDRAWKEFAAGLDERTSVLALSVLFHHKAEQVKNIFRFLFNIVTVVGNWTARTFRWVLVKLCYVKDYE